MPRAVRKATLDAKPPLGKRSDPVGSSALNARMVTPDSAASLPHLQPRMIDWHGALAQVSGAMTMAFKRGPSRDAAAAWAAQLRLIADDIEKRI